MLVAAALALVLAGSLVYCVLTVIAARRYLAVRPAAATRMPPISVLKPLSGADLGLEENLRTFFLQDYPDYELLFAVREADDPAAAVVERLRREFPSVAARLIVTGEPPYPNAKVWSLSMMWTAARHDLVVMSDSDIRVTARLLRTIAAEFDDPAVGLATCPYRAVPGQSFWSALEAVGMNTEFLGGVLTARMMEGMRFALGPTIAVRRQALDGIGGWNSLTDYLAEDFVMGNRIAASGYVVLLSSYVIEHHIGATGFMENWRHRLRWARSTRRSRPKGYLGQVFTNPLPLALLICTLRPDWWPLLPVTAVFRAAAAFATAGWVLRDRLTLRMWWSVPLQDIYSFATWLGGFAGNTILWRGRRYYLRPDGRFELVR